MIIALCGKGASGKTTVSKMLAEKLKLRRYSVGDMMRELATERGVTLLELNKIAEKDQSIDKWYDQRQEALGKEEDNFIIDSRLGFKFIPHAIKILLDVEDKDAAKRVFNALPRTGEEPYKGVDDALLALVARRKSEIKRIKKLYGINPYDKRHFDLMLDTTGKTPEQVCKEILAFLRRKSKN